MNKIIPFILVITFLILGFFLLNKSQDENFSEEYYVKIAGKNIKVELVDTPAGHAQGLSGRQGLNNDEGMLFIFDKSSIYPFWMKDMKFAIDIIWISEEKKVIYIKKDAKPEDYPQSYNPESPALYVLEVATGFSEKNNLKVGDEIEFSL